MALVGVIALLAVLLIALLIVWAIASIPVYVAGKLLTAGRATFGAAMGATLGGFVALLAVYRASFDTGWLGALAIAVVDAVIAVVIGAILAAYFGVSFPATGHPGVNV